MDSAADLLLRERVRKWLQLRRLWMQLTDPVAKRRNKVLRVCEVRHKERAAASAAALFFFPPKSWLLLSATQAPARIPCGKLCMLDVALLRFHRAPHSLAKERCSYVRAQKLAAHSRIQSFDCIGIPRSGFAGRG